ncbi:MAG TPA: inositol monophosphatase family protein [Myxococcales bacterium]|nr:inositol monophosphatase family protein [Myxococcales bacterium]
MNPAQLERICVSAAQAGAKVLRELFEKPREITLKGRIDLVTDADRAAEETILRLLRERAPGASVLAEESGESGRGEVRFIVDPLDGTTNYTHGIPLFTCTVGAEVSGELVAGCTVDPMRAETFRAHRGGGAFVGARKLAVSSTAKMEEAVACTGFPYGHREKLPTMVSAFGRFTEAARGTRRLGSAAMDLAYVAAGRLDVFWEQGLRPWDMAAGIVLVREAGGIVTRFDGSALDLADGEILASTPALHQAARAILASAAGGKT